METSSDGISATGTSLLDHCSLSRKLVHFVTDYLRSSLSAFDMSKFSTSFTGYIEQAAAKEIRLQVEQSISTSAPCLMDVVRSLILPFS